LVPGLLVTGVDISSYAIENSHQNVKNSLTFANATKLPFSDGSFDYVFSLNTLHNLPVYDLFLALAEIERVGRRRKYVCVESYRNEVEKANLLYWQVTCESFFTPEEWLWCFEKAGYSGDYSFIYFD